MIYLLFSFRVKRRVQLSKLSMYRLIRFTHFCFAGSECVHDAFPIEVLELCKLANRHEYLSVVIVFLLLLIPLEVLAPAMLQGCKTLIFTPTFVDRTKASFTCSHV
jgi:hypothetical protein